MNILYYINMFFNLTLFISVVVLYYGEKIKIGSTPSHIFDLHLSCVSNFRSFVFLFFNSFLFLLHLNRRVGFFDRGKFVWIDASFFQSSKQIKCVVSYNSKICDMDQCQLTVLAILNQLHLLLQRLPSQSQRILLSVGFHS